MVTTVQIASTVVADRCQHSDPTSIIMITTGKGLLEAVFTKYTDIMEVIREDMVTRTGDNDNLGCTPSHPTTTIHVDETRMDIIYPTKIDRTRR
jgi:hypothetical protein